MKGRADAWTHGSGDAGRWGHGDMGKQGCGDAGAQGCRDTGTQGHGDAGTQGQPPRCQACTQPPGSGPPNTALWSLAAGGVAADQAQAPDRG